MFGSGISGGTSTDCFTSGQSWSGTSIGTSVSKRWGRMTFRLFWDLWTKKLSVPKLSMSVIPRVRQRCLLGFVTRSPRSIWTKISISLLLWVPLSIWYFFDFNKKKNHKIKSLKLITKLPGLQMMLRTIGNFSLFNAYKSKDHIVLKLQTTMLKTIPSTSSGIIWIVDKNPKLYNNMKRLPEFLKYHPCGASMRCVVHFQQLHREDEYFKMYDFGEAKNKKLYKQEKPPSYDLWKIKVPIIGFMGEYDQFMGEKDIGFMTKNFKRAGIYFRFFTVQNCGHMTYFWGKNPQFFWDILEEFEGNWFTLDSGVWLKA